MPKSYYDTHAISVQQTHRRAKFNFFCSIVILVFCQPPFGAAWSVWKHCFKHLKERFVQIYRDFINIESTSYRDFANIDMFWDLKRKLVKEGVGDSHRTEQEDFSLKMWRVIVSHSNPPHVKLEVCEHKKKDWMGDLSTCKDLCFCHGSLEEEDLLHFAPPRIADEVEAR